MQVNRSLVHPGHEGRTTGRTNRRSGKHPGVAHALHGQLIEVRGMNPLSAKTTEVQIAVIGDQPEDIGLVLGQGNRGKEEYRKQGK